MKSFLSQKANPCLHTLLPMEFIIFLICSLLISISLVVKILRKPKPNTSLLPPPPPGPRKLAFIGNIHQLMFGSGLPHHTLRDLANKHGPLMHLKLGEIPVVVVSSPEMAKKVFQTHDLTFSNRPISQASWTLSYNNSDIAFSPYGDLWRQLRKICTSELLTQKRVQEFRSIREDEIFTMIKSITSEEEEGQVVNLSKKIHELNYTIVARTAFGKISKYHKEFIAAEEAIIDVLGGFHIFDMFPSFKILQRVTGFERKLEILHNQLDRIVGNILNEHKLKVPNEVCERKDDLIDVLLNIQKQGESNVPLTDKSIKAVILDIFTAGGETSATTIEWTISELIRNPAIMSRAQAEVRKVYHGRDNVNESKLDELNYLQAVVKETLRLHPPAVLLVPRESRTQCNIDGYEIPAKTTVLINAWAIGRDPKCWIHADKFDPDRFLDSKIEYKGNHFQYIPFGGGRRICPGISYAIPNIHLSLAQLLFHFDWKLPGEMIPGNLDMTEKYGLSVRRKNDLRLIPIPYISSYLSEKEALKNVKVNQHQS